MKARMQRAILIGLIAILIVRLISEMLLVAIVRAMPRR
jgi:hypothetical protein